MDQAVKCLNPFFIRSAVGIDTAAEVTKNGRLNPFFIRSAVGMDDAWNDRKAGDVLIPSSSGLRLEYLNDVQASLCMRLNPFFIRSAVGIGSTAMKDMHDCLNPFFIRSAVGMACHCFLR